MSESTEQCLSPHVCSSKGFPAGFPIIPSTDPFVLMTTSLMLVEDMLACAHPKGGAPAQGLC